MKTIPKPVIAVVSECLAEYYTHAKLNSLFYECGADGEVPKGNKLTKCLTWLNRCNENSNLQSHNMLGKILEVFMEKELSYSPYTDTHLANRKRIQQMLGKYNLSYQVGGKILGSTTGIASASLNEILIEGDLESLEKEFQRALDSINTDPASGLTAACAIVESLCKIYIEDEKLQLPSDQSIKPLWKVVSRHLGLDPASVIDDDLKRILSGLTSIVDGLGSLRTHRGTAHGQGRKPYRIEARHARLATHSAHTLCVFIIETWNIRKKKSD